MSVNVKNQITPVLKSIQTKLNNLPLEAYKEFVKDTPIRSGHARRSTKLRGNIINANYPYAKRLDEGYSQQSPNGMTTPTEAFIKKRVKQILKGK
jgi:hypothetical protein